MEVHRHRPKRYKAIELFVEVRRNGYRSIKQK